MTDVLADLAQERGRFVAFAASRVRDGVRAEELVQRALLKAAASAHGLLDASKAQAWFFQILRNVIVDDARERAVEQRRVARFEAPDVEGGAVKPCSCVQRAITSLDAQKRSTLDALVVEEERISSFASRTGSTPNAVSVRLHRAKRELEQRILAFCGPCCARGCGACACA